MLTEEKLVKIENQITEEKKTVDFDTREFTIEFLVQKYNTKTKPDVEAGGDAEAEIDGGETELFVPDYQRDFVWDTERQSKLIESVTLGLPIPIIFLAEDKNGRLEIVDGSQRIRTLSSFLMGELVLEGLEKLTEMNGVKFDYLPASRKRKINNTAIRMIVLSDAATEEVRNDLFERINRGSDLLRSMEKRKGIYHGQFNDFIYKTCAKNPLLAENAPLAKSVKNRQEHEELVLRFFACIDNFPNLSHYQRSVVTVLDEYMKDKNISFTDAEKAVKLDQYEKMLAFVTKTFAFGFTRGMGRYVSRTMFEAISAGVHFALEAKPDLVSKKVDFNHWMQDKNFNTLISSEKFISKSRLIEGRIAYVRDRLLKEQEQ